MRNPLQALLWELWRLSWRDAVVRIALIVALWVLMFSLRDPGEVGKRVIAAIAMVTVGATSVFSGAWMNSLDNTRAGFGFRLGFTRPITTSLLVVTPILFVIGTALVVFLTPLLLIGALYDLHVPLLAPSAVIACLTACMVAATWSPTTYPTRVAAIVAVLATFAAVGAWIVLSQPVGEPLLLRLGDPQFTNLPWWRYAVLLGVTVAAIGLTVWAVERQRRGEPVSLSMFFLRDTESRPPKVAAFAEFARFSSAWRAQWWLEFQRSGRRVLLVAAIAAPAAFLLIGSAAFFSPQAGKQIPGMWTVVTLLMSTVFVILGTDWLLGFTRQQGVTSFSAFDSVQPMGNDTMVAIKLAVLTLSNTGALAVLVSAAVIHTLLVGAGRQWTALAADLIKSPTITVWDWVGGAIALLLGFLSSAAMLLTLGYWMARYEKVLAVLCGWVFVHMILMTFDLTNAWSLGPLWTAYGWLFAAVLIGLCGWSIVTARLRGYLTAPRLTALAVLWAVYLAATLWPLTRLNLVEKFSLPPAALAVGLAALTIPLTAVVACPLALGANRHR